MRVSFDIDGVFADFVLAFTKKALVIAPYYFESFQGHPVEVFGTTQQKEWKFDWPDWFYANVWNEIDCTQNWWMTLEPLVSEKDINAVNFIIANHDVYFITSRKRTAGLNVERQCEYWLDGIGVNASQATVIATQSSKKHKLINAMDIDAHIDDKPAIVKDVANHSGAVSCILHQPYNTGNWNQKHRFYSVEAYCEWVNTQVVEK